MRLAQHQALALFVGSVAGIFGTWLMDRIGAFLRARSVIGGPPFPLVAKWFAYLARGRVFHGDITATPDVPISPRRMMIIHYAIGLGLGGVYAGLTLVATGPSNLLRSIASSTESTTPTLLALALLYGIATSVLAWWLMFPGMGYGIFGRRAPAQLKLFRSSFVNHAVFGLGLGAFYCAAELVVGALTI